MGRQPHVGRVGKLAAALGIGAAVMTSWGCATAWADEAGKSPASSESSSSSAGPRASTGGSTADTDASDTSKRKNKEAATSTRATRERDDDTSEPGGADDDADRPANAKIADTRHDSAHRAASDIDSASDSSETPQDSESAPSQSDTHSDEPASTETTGTVTLAPSKPTANDAPPTDDAPPAPAAEPQLFTLMAASRRKFDPDAGTAIASPQVAVAQNSVTLTPPPTFFDKLVVAGFKLTRVISDIIGVDVNALANGLISSERPPWFVRTGLDVRQTKHDLAEGSEWSVWEFHPPEPTGKTVVAFHGGGYVQQPNLLLWSDYSKMAKDTGATVLVPLYPLATTDAGRATKVIPAAADFVSDQIELHGAENVSVYGDSAGSALALGAVRLLVLSGRAVPASMVLLSLTADGSLENPDIRAIDDPIFNIDNLDAYTSHWYDGVDRKDPLVSPLFAEPEVLQALPPTTLYVGELEIAYPDTLLLQQKWSAAGGTVTTVVGQGLPHDWALSSMFFAQSRAVRPNIYRELGLDSRDRTAVVSHPTRGGRGEDCADKDFMHGSSCITS